jgi:2-polyprenyl-6-methoxyphenol hydroxylase-like FAD-dependent oxidoreductase
MDVLVCGASVAGPTLAYWLRRYGFRVTIVERAPALRKAGGHAVDLFAPALDIIERMGLLDPVTEHRTGTDRITVRREGARRPVTIDLGRLMGAVSRRHVEIMRDDLGEILHAATRNDVEYLFGDSVASVSDDAEVTFERGLRDSMECVVDVDRLAGMYSARHMSDARARSLPRSSLQRSRPGPGLPRTWVRPTRPSTTASLSATSLSWRRRPAGRL